MPETKRIRWFDWAVFAVLAVLCNLVFQQADILHTGGASFAYLNGHITDFYSYTNSTIGGCRYMPTTYILFAVWNLPLKLLGLKTDVSMAATLPVQLWYTGLPILAYAGIAVVMFRLALLMGFSEKKARVAAYAFAASPIAFFSQFIIGQYDSLTLFFVMLGVYYYFKNDTVRFVLFFSVAMTCKYFALLIFVPMVLLKEKKVWPILRQGVCFMLLFAAETAFYLQDKAMAGNIIGFNATGYIFNVALDTGTNFPKISLVILVWGSLCAWAFFTNPENLLSRWKWFLYLESLVMFCVFGLSMWHPQWVMLAVPFLVFGTMMHKRNDIFWLLDLGMMLAFVWFTEYGWPNNLDQALMRQGILNDLIGPRYFSGLTMESFYSYSRSIPFSVLSGLFLINTLFKHPKYQIESPEADTDPQIGLLRTRFLAGIALFLVPCAVCLFTMLRGPYALSEHVANAISPDYVIALQDEKGSRELEQYFRPDRDTVERIDVKFDGYEHTEGGDVLITMVDTTAKKTVKELRLPRSAIVSPAAHHITFDPVPVDPSHRYKLVFSCDPAGSDYLGVYYDPADVPKAFQVAVDGKRKRFSLAVDVFGR